MKANRNVSAPLTIRGIIILAFFVVATITLGI